MNNDDDVGDFKKYKDKTDYQISLEAFFIALINQYATITIKKRTVKTSVTLPYLCITEISFNHFDTIKVDDFIQNRIKQEYDSDIINGIKEATAHSRLKKKRIILALQFLEDILFELGYRFHYTFFRRKNKTVCGELVSEIFKLDVNQLKSNEQQKNEVVHPSIFYSDSEIKKVGVKINAYLYNVLEKKNTK